MAQLQIALHLRPPEIKEAVLETDVFGDLLVVHHERRRQRRVEDFDFAGEHFDFAADQILVDGALGTRAHLAADADDEFVAQRLGGLEGRRIVRIAHHLQEAGAVAQVDENDAAMIAPAVHPAEDGDGLLQMGAVDRTAIIATHGGDRT